MNTLTVKIPSELERTLDMLAARTHQTRSELVRQALQSFVQAHEAQGDTASLLDAMPDLVGCFSGGPADLSVNPAHLSEFGR